MSLSSIDLSSVVPPQTLGDVLLVLTVIGLGAMGADKASAKIGFDRIRERNLALIALAGGFAGVTLGGLFFHHKTSQSDFWVPIGAAWVIWGAFLIVYLFPGILRF
jgi:uncharacterized membrane protein YsdA (DUF1294 family)